VTLNGQGRDPKHLRHNIASTKAQTAAMGQVLRSTECILATQ